MTEKVQPNYGMLAVLMVGAFIALLNNTLINVAMPSIMHHFQISESTVQWLQTGFMLVNGIVIPATAFLIQKYSVRHLFLGAMGLFACGTLIAGFAPYYGVLLAGRLTQAAGAAIMLPLLMNVMLVSFPPERRGQAMGLFGLVMVFAPAAGPTLSGWIVQHYHWPVIFRLVAPIAILVWVVAWFVLRDNKEKGDISLDSLSLVLSTLGFGGILYSVGSAGNRGWSDPLVYGGLAIGLVALVCFIMRQLKLEKPMLNFRVFRYPMFSLSTAIVITMSLSMFSAMLLLPLYLQNLRGFSPLESGLLLLPGALCLGLMSPLAGRWFDRFGARGIAVAGISLLAITSFLYSQLTDSTSYYWLMTIHALRMMGISMVMMPVTTNGLNALPPHYYPHGTAMNNTIQQVAGAMGSSLLVTVMSNRTAVHAREMLASDQLAATTGPGAGQAAEELIQVQAAIQGVNDAFLLSTFIALAALVLAFFIQRTTGRREKEGSPGPAPTGETSSRESITAR